MPARLEVLVSTLRVYALARQLVRAVNQLLPRIAERSRELADQLDRSSRSVPANIAEGEHRRDGHGRQRFKTAYGSARETRAHLESAVDIGALREDEVARAIDLADPVAACLYNLVRVARRELGARVGGSDVGPRSHGSSQKSPLPPPAPPSEPSPSRRFRARALARWAHQPRSSGPGSAPPNRTFVPVSRVRRPGGSIRAGRSVSGGRRGSNCRGRRTNVRPMDDFTAALDEIRAFVRERDWERFHDPKNLAMAVASEAGELVAELRWVPSEEADAFARRPDVRARLEEEAADIAITLLMFCDRANIDLLAAMRRKLRKNAEKYPVDVVRGRHER